MNLTNAIYVKYSTRHLPDGEPHLYESIVLNKTEEHIRYASKNRGTFMEETILELRPAKAKDKIRCEYCGAEVNLGNAIAKEYYTNHTRVFGIFCSEQCHSFRQMGAEG